MTGELYEEACAEECVALRDRHAAAFARVRILQLGARVRADVHTRDGKVICLPIESLMRVAENIGELQPPEIRVLAGFDEDEALLAQVRCSLLMFLN